MQSCAECQAGRFSPEAGCGPAEQMRWRITWARVGLLGVTVALLMLAVLVAREGAVALAWGGLGALVLFSIWGGARLARLRMCRHLHAWRHQRGTEKLKS